MKMENYAETMVEWYIKNKRNLPWREDNLPYHIWISEIMLQQTRIEAVIDYYKRFIKEIPNIESLASVEEDKLLKLWEGLGYYNRAKNLKASAIQIMNNYQGNFPTEYTEILKLPGIGEYTASAIASICFKEKQVTIDGNVLRVYTRFYNDTRPIDEVETKKNIREKLLAIIPENSGEFNQGLMELGETVCIPTGIPKCEICPLSKDCLAREKNTYLTLPVKKSKKEKIEEQYTVLLYKYLDLFAIYKRTETSLLHNLWAFPMLEKFLTLTQLKKYLKEQNIKYESITTGPNHCHIFTHKKWNMNSYIIEVSSIDNLSKYKWVNKKELEEKYAIPTAFQPFKKKILESEEKE